MPRVEATAAGPNRWSPLLAIGAVVGGARGNFTALLDSGADMTILPGELAEAFGVNFAALTPLSGPGVGVGGTFDMRWRTEISPTPA